MEIILTEDVPHVGNMGDVVEVKAGYGRNYLIPKGLAVLATRSNRAHFEHTLRVIEEKRAKLRSSALELAEQLGDISITIAKKAGDDDRLFGSVTNRDIEAALAAAGHTIDRRRIVLREPIKSLGIYSVPLKLHADVEVPALVWVCAI
ncbi:MAG: 50S ribosomal protein L9 [Myxococcales bacterium]|nr:50S ribosomal protein L9 [Myxococcales bacterium]MCB9519977.1 50S ribosomal protein L9 [Myxococcales bacterium]MCB9533112.1 50S ribosomal protein L9 [Myxococcales bacterium]